MAEKSIPLYEQVANNIAHLIQQNTLQVGDRIPSIRQLRSQLGVSVSTVMEAYRLLESEGLIEARPQSGYYVRQPFPLQLSEPTISAPTSIAAEVGNGTLISEILSAATDPTMVPLGASGLNPDLLPTDKLNQQLAKVARHIGSAGNVYDLPPGHELIRRRIALRSITWGGSLTADDIVMTCGCMEALNLSLKAVARPGDVIAIESPVYYGFLQILESLGMKALEIPCHPRDGISLEALEAAIAQHSIKACLFTLTFNNPLGSCMPDDTKQQLVELLRRRQIPLIEDDVWGELYFGDHRPKPAKAFDTEGLVLLCSSFSKDLAPGYRVGWVVPGRFQQHIERLKHSSTIANPVVLQLAIAEFLQSGGYDQHLRRLRKTHSSSVQRITQTVSQFFPDGTKITRPGGGYLLWVELPPTVDGMQLYRSALAHQISVVPGVIFSPTPHYHNYIRLHAGNLWSPEIEQAIATLGWLAKQLD